MQTIEEKLRAAIKRCGLTQTELADAAGVSQSAVSNFTRGCGIRLSTAIILIECLRKKGMWKP